ncbi:hypothetical protein [Okeania sp. KiyG1]|uniref:hypothetical protein n=1 Tax=Okeania sp. KiyG1 TaxID=2720165 RepID=UPI0019241140|nr:hypothetical protein [Okeania sp. KiyG1]GGA15066.1 hypothetical protein CYANOKiyG1_28800 [Okeania sp. KiyG1]
MLRIFGTGIGIFVVGISAYWGALDFMRLTEANQQLAQSAFELSDREFQYLLSREKTHMFRIFGKGIGIFVVGISAYWGALDFMRLTEANQQLAQSAFELSDREFQYLLSREKLICFAYLVKELVFLLLVSPPIGEH